MQTKITDYEYESTHKYEGAYTQEEVELNIQLYEECVKKDADLDKIEELLKNGADPLGATAVSGWDLLEHVCEMLFVGDTELNDNMPRIMRLFYKYGMNFSNPRVPYDDDNSLHPMWSFAFCHGDNALRTLEVMVENGLTVEEAEYCLSHEICDYYNVGGELQDEYDYNAFYDCIRKILLIASYPHILKNDEALQELLWVAENDYDVTRFRKWNDFDFEIDTSRCERFPEVYRSVVTVIEKATGKKVWKFGFKVKPEETDG